MQELAPRWAFGWPAPGSAPSAMAASCSLTSAHAVVSLAVFAFEGELLAMAALIELVGELGCAEARDDRAVALGWVSACIAVGVLLLEQPTRVMHSRVVVLAARASGDLAHPPGATVIMSVSLRELRIG